MHEPASSLLAIYFYVMLLVWCCADCSGVGVLSIHSVKPVLKAVFDTKTSLFLCQSLSSLFLSSFFLTHTHTVVVYISISISIYLSIYLSLYIYIYATWSIKNSSVFNPCCVDTVTVIWSTDHLLIQLHTNTFRFNRPFAHTLSLPQAHTIIPLHLDAAAIKKLRSYFFFL